MMWLALHIAPERRCGYGDMAGPTTPDRLMAVQSYSPPVARRFLMLLAVSQDQHRPAGLRNWCYGVTGGGGLSALVQLFAEAA